MNFKQADAAARFKHLNDIKEELQARNAELSKTQIPFQIQPNVDIRYLNKRQLFNEAANFAKSRLAAAEAVKLTGIEFDTETHRLAKVSEWEKAFKVCGEILLNNEKLCAIETLIERQRARLSDDDINAMEDNSIANELAALGI